MFNLSSESILNLIKMSSLRHDNNLLNRAGDPDIDSQSIDLSNGSARKPRRYHRSLDDDGQNVLSAVADQRLATFFIVDRLSDKQGAQYILNIYNIHFTIQAKSMQKTVPDRIYL
jgi:hypothetical protein